MQTALGRLEDCSKVRVPRVFLHMCSSVWDLHVVEHDMANHDDDDDDDGVSCIS